MSRSHRTLPDGDRRWMNRTHDAPLLVEAELGVQCAYVAAAARTGRLVVTCHDRLVFGKRVARATRSAGARFMQAFYKQSYHPHGPAPSAPPLPEIPVNYAVRLLRLRRTLRLTQTELAQTLGVASKAVVYQWETRKRRPCPILWARVELLESGIGA